MRRISMCLLVFGLASAVFGVAPAGAGGVSATLEADCTQVTFTYNGLGNSHVSATETATLDGNQFAPYTPTATWDDITNDPSTHSNPLPGAPLTGNHTVHLETSFTFQGTNHHFSRDISLNCGGGGCTHDCTPPCTASKANFRWHYSSNGTSGSWSATKSQPCPGTFSMGPQSMEGDLKVSPGPTIKGGYDFNVPGNNATKTLTVSNATLVFIVHCVGGGTPSAPTFTMTMPDQTYTFSGSGWQPSGDQKSSLVYQGSVTAPDLCGGGKLRLDKGATFSASLS